MKTSVSSYSSLTLIEAFNSSVKVETVPAVHDDADDQAGDESTVKDAGQSHYPSTRQTVVQATVCSTNVCKTSCVGGRHNMPPLPSS